MFPTLPCSNDFAAAAIGLSRCENLLANRDAPAGDAPTPMRSASSTARGSKGPARPAFGWIFVRGRGPADRRFRDHPARQRRNAGSRARSTTATVIADRGYPQPESDAHVRDSGADLLVRLTWNSLNLRARRRKPIHWLDAFAKADALGHVDIPVAVHKARGGFEPLPMRLVITPKPPDHAERARDVARHNARKPA